MLIHKLGYRFYKVIGKLNTIEMDTIIVVRASCLKLLNFEMTINVRKRYHRQKDRSAENRANKFNTKLFTYQT